MDAASDVFGHPKLGFVPAKLFAAVLFVLLLLNWFNNLTGKRLAKLDSSEYRSAESENHRTEA